MEWPITYFEKPPLSIPEQVVLLQNRGMVVTDEDWTFLEIVSFFRLMAYWKPFERDDGNPDGPAFQDGLDFGRIRNLYLFDRKLRMLLLDGIERIEVALRARWGNLMAEKYGPHGYLDRDCYYNRNFHERNISELRREFKRSSEVYVNFYRENHTFPVLPPVWMATELMSFGLLSKIIGNLKHRGDKNVLARSFDLDMRVFTSFLHQLSTVRNFCAHHGRVWNRRFTVPFLLPNSPMKLSSGLNRDGERYLYNTLVMIKHLLGFIVFDHDDPEWKENLIQLIDGNPQIELSRMGFPADWQDREIWRLA